MIGIESDAFVDRFAGLFNPEIVAELKTNRVRELVGRISTASAKTVGEAVLVVIYAIRYLHGNREALTILAQGDDFGTFVDRHADAIVELGINKRVQGNLPERGLPLLELFADLPSDRQIRVLELGASFGLIGRCLLDPEAMIENRGRYFRAGQQMPSRFRKADAYLGIDLDPPDAGWLLACILDPANSIRVEAIIGSGETPVARVVKASALGFSARDDVRDFFSKEDTICVVLTSFMMYQLPKDLSRQLREEIKTFVEKNRGIWINQDVETTEGDAARYYLEWNGKEMLGLSDDICSSWDRKEVKHVR